MSGFVGFMSRIVKLAELQSEITAHVLRHSLASVAADLQLRKSPWPRLSAKRGGITDATSIRLSAVLPAAADKAASEVRGQMGEAMLESQVVQVPLRVA
nr:hypothetical protein [uncultured Roseococcus sp.]